MARSLSTAGDAGKKFYASILREDAVMLFPGGMRIDVSTIVLAAAMLAWFDLFAFRKAVYLPEWASFLPLSHSQARKRSG